MVTTLNGVVRAAATAHGMPVLDAEAALSGHRLCENTVGLLEEKGIASWTSPGAADRTEWVSQIRTVTTLVPPYQLQEDLHPSYWGQKALRNCVRQAYNGGTPARRHVHAAPAGSTATASRTWRSTEPGRGPGPACPG